MDAKTTYQYTPLSGTKSIRLLELAAGQWHDEIRGCLHCITISLDQQYEALSYVWGPSNEGRTISINENARIEITDNLFRALRRLRKKRKPRTIWIDAICINQDDNAEKSQQVRMMSKIYGNASCVRVWLGESEHASSVHLQPLFRKPNALAGQLLSTVVNAKNEVPLFARSARRSTSGEDEPLAELSPWYERVWTVQEYVLAQKVTLHWGKAVIEVEDIAYRGDFEAEITKTALRSHLPIYVVKNLFDSIKKLQNFRNGSKDRDLLHTFRFLLSEKFGKPMAATNPLDKIYALFGIVNSRLGFEIGVDYDLTQEQLAAKATFVCLKYDLDVDFLRLVRVDRFARGSCLPTWSIDFFQESFPPLTLSYRGCGRSNGLHAINLDETCRLLKFTGVAFDVVISKYCPGSLPGADSRTTIPSRTFLHADTQRGLGVNLVMRENTISCEYPDLLDFEDCITMTREGQKTGTTPHGRQVPMAKHNMEILKNAGLGVYTQGGGGAEVFHAYLLENSPAVIFGTSSGLIGKATHAIQSGDVLVYTPESFWKVVLRKEKHHFSFCGLAHIPGHYASPTGERGYFRDLFATQADCEAMEDLILQSARPFIMC